VHGSDGYAASNYFAYGIHIINASNITYSNVDVVGTGGSGYTNLGAGVVLGGTSTANSVVHNFTGCTFNYVGTGILYGAYVQGVTVSQSNFTGSNGYGINVPVSESGLDQLVVTNSQFNVTGNAIYTGTDVPNTMLLGNLFIVPASSNGVFLNSSGLFSIAGNSFNVSGSKSGQNFVVIGTSANDGGVISGNMFDGAPTAINLLTGSTHVNVQSNFYVANTANVVNSGTANVVGGGSP
jgi:hypothetical protein